MPLHYGSADVVLSNCMFNLAPDKKVAFADIHRILKTGGHFCISDIVLTGELSPVLLESAELHAGCAAGAVQRDDYLRIIAEVGFQNIEVKENREIVLPGDLLLKIISPTELVQFRDSGTGIYSITVVGVK